MIKIKKIYTIVATFLLIISFSTSVLASSLSESILNDNIKFSNDIVSIDKIQEYTKTAVLDTEKQITLTPLEKKALSYYKDTPLKVGVYESDPFFTEIDGEYYGINYFFMEAFKNEFDIKVSYIIDTKENIAKMYNNKELDIILSFQKDFKELTNPAFSRAYFYESPVIFSKDMTKGDISTEGLSNKKLGKLKSNGAFDEKTVEELNSNGYSINLIEYNTNAELLQALENKDIDLIVSYKNSFFLSNGLFMSKFSNDDFGVYHYAVFKDDEMSLLAVFNDYIGEDTKRFLYFYEDTFNKARFKSGLFFTEEEKRYLNKKKLLDVKVLTDASYPFVYLDKDNDINGTQTYIFDRICKVLDITYNITVDDSTNYLKIASELSNYKYDVILGLPEITSNNEYTDKAKSISSSKYTLIGYKDDVYNIHDIFGSKIGLVEGERISEYLIKYYPIKEFVFFSTQEDALNALYDGEIEYLPVNESFYIYLIYMNSDYNIKNCHTLNLNFDNTIFFTKNDDSEILASIFSKSLDYISSEEILNRSSSFYKNSIISAVYLSNIKGVLIIVLPFLLLLVAYLIHNNYKIRRNRKEIYDLTEKYSDILVSTGSCFWYFDIKKEELVITQDLIDLVGLDESCYAIKEDRIILLLNDKLTAYFTDIGIINSIISVFNQILNLEESKAEFEFEIKKGMNENNIIRIKTTLRYDNNTDNKSVYGLIQNTTASYLYKNKLLNMALIDPLTGADNRNAMFEDLLENYAGKVFCYMDLDDFKTVNDTYGHDHGDFVLKKVVARAQAISGIDKVYRIGGDEFILVQNKFSKKAIEEVQEAIALPIINGDKTYQVYATIGVLDTSIKKPATFDECLRTTDMLMLYAKSKGKNKVEYFDKKKVYPSILTPISRK